MVCKCNYLTNTYEYLAGVLMNEITINILPENFKPLPVTFHTASARFNQLSMDYTGTGPDFYQILIILEGRGVLYCNGETHELRKDCAFFTAIHTQSKYINKGGLVSAFLTVKGDGMSQLIEHFGWGDFKFFPNVNTERWVADLKTIINEYYKTKNESILSALSYSFYINFFEDHQENTFASIDKTALYIEQNFNKMLTLDELAHINKTSVSKLCHDFKKKYGYTIFQHILTLRLNYAHNLLKSTADIKTKDVATACGFDDISYFCRLYKRKFGTTPLDRH